jgi:hypothetical protein
VIPFNREVLGFIDALAEARDFSAEASPGL